MEQGKLRELELGRVPERRVTKLNIMDDQHLKGTIEEHVIELINQINRN